VNEGRPSGYIERVRQTNVAGEERPSPLLDDHDEEFFPPGMRKELLSECAAGNEWIRSNFRPELDSLFPD
jgi:hypothetical protein